MGSYHVVFGMPSFSAAIQEYYLFTLQSCWKGNMKVMHVKKALHNMLLGVVPISLQSTSLFRKMGPQSYASEVRPTGINGTRHSQVCVDMTVASVYTFCTSHQEINNGVVGKGEI